MDLREAFGLALEMLLANRVRSALTTLGVVIGVAAIILLVSLGEGATAYITREMTGLGTNLLIVTPGKTQTSGGFHPPLASTVRKLTYEDAVALRRRATLLTDAVPVVIGSGKVRYLGASRDTSVIGATAYITREMTGLGTNLLIVTPGKTQTSGGFHPPLASTVRKLTYEDAVALRRRATLLTDAVPVVIGSGKVRYLGASRDTSVIGVTPEFQRVRNLYVEIGQFVDAEDVEGRRRVVVLGRTVKRELFGEENPLGRFVTLADSRYRVIGIMERKGMSLGFDIDDLVFIPVKSAQDLFDTDRLFEILASVRSPEEVDLAMRQVKDVLIRRHGGREDFTVVSQGAILSSFTTILRILTAVLGGIAGISLLVGGIGIMNIMLVSVRERTREIGIRKAVGARRRDILGQFLLESVVLSSLGGALGILVGIGGAKGLSFFFTYLPTHVSLWAVLMAVGFSAAVGVFFGVYPARRASSLDPIQALRYE